MEQELVVHIPATGEYIKAAEGDRSKLSKEDIADGYCDYVIYDCYKQPVDSIDIDPIHLDRYEPYDGGILMLKTPFSEAYGDIAKAIPDILDMAGYSEDTVYELTFEKLKVSLSEEYINIRRSIEKNISEKLHLEPGTEEFNQRSAFFNGIDLQQHNLEENLIDLGFTDEQLSQLRHQATFHSKTFVEEKYLLPWKVDLKGMKVDKDLAYEIVDFFHKVDPYGAKDAYDSKSEAVAEINKDLNSREALEALIKQVHESHEFISVDDIDLLIERSVIERRLEATKLGYELEEMRIDNKTAALKYEFHQELKDQGFDLDGITFEQAFMSYLDEQTSINKDLHSGLTIHEIDSFTESENFALVVNQARSR